MITIIKIIVGSVMLVAYFEFICGLIINALKQVAREGNFRVPEKANIYTLELAIGMLAWIFVTFLLLMR